jgi:hypothetical protein
LRPRPRSSRPRGGNAHPAHHLDIISVFLIVLPLPMVDPMVWSELQVAFLPSSPALHPNSRPRLREPDMSGDVMAMFPADLPPWGWRSLRAQFTGSRSTLRSRPWGRGNSSWVSTIPAIPTRAWWFVAPTTFRRPIDSGSNISPQLHRRDRYHHFQGAIAESTRDEDSAVLRYGERQDMRIGPPAVRRVKPLARFQMTGCVRLRGQGHTGG